MPGRTRSTSMMVGIRAARARRAACVGGGRLDGSRTTNRPARGDRALPATADCFQRKAGMAVPEHRSLPGARIDQHDGELVGGARHGPGRPDVHTFANQAVARATRPTSSSPKLPI